MEKVADGNATKLIIPSELQGVAGLAAGLKEMVDSTGYPEKNEKKSDDIEQEHDKYLEKNDADPMNKSKNHGEWTSLF